jgi:hypothetical protein
MTAMSKGGQLMHIDEDNDGGSRGGNRPTAFDLVTKLLLPIALVVIASLQQQVARFWALLGFAVLSITFGFYAHIQRAAHRFVRTRRDERIGKRQFQRLKQFVLAFGDFLDPARSDNLHNIVVDSICHNNVTEFGKLHLAPKDVYFAWHQHLKKRVETQKATLDNLEEAIREFGPLVNYYDQDCVLAIFDRYPVADRPAISAAAGSNLEAFRQRFDRFLYDYSNYLKGLDASFSTPRIRAYYFVQPKPLPPAETA